MKDINQLVKQFRDAIVRAKDDGEFAKDIAFSRFPNGCCGDASDLLAQFLLEHGIKTYYICGTYSDNSFDNTQSHAWLLCDNRKIIIDIMGDQFKSQRIFLNYDKAVYVGAKDEFHKLFEVNNSRDIHENNGIEALGSVCQPRLKKLYKTILNYMDE